MSERVLRGAPASPGTAAGAAHFLNGGPPASTSPLAADERSAEADRVEPALRAAGEEIERLARRLREDGRTEEADIVATGALMAEDPVLARSASEAVLVRGLPAALAIQEAADSHASAIAALDDPTLAARADDVRSLGRRAARAAGRDGADRAPASSEVVLVARDLGPADVGELGPEVRGIVLAAGAVTAHAAIVARSLGIPMVVRAGEAALEILEGETIVVEGGTGSAVVDPAAARLETAREELARAVRARVLARERRELPAETRDGRRVRVLANVASAAEAALALEAGAEGAGLIRTELAFLDAQEWPGRDAHHAALAPLLRALGDATATVRVLDFGGDKVPPFLRGSDARGIELLLAHPRALVAQLHGILGARGGGELRLLLPLVTEPEQISSVRDLLASAVADVGAGSSPALGAMIELPEAARRAAEIAAEADFLSVGTNDLTAATLGEDRFEAGSAPAHHPRVLTLIADTLRAARAEGVSIEICGEAASDPMSVPLLVGLGADELSVGAARVGIVRDWVRELSFDDAARLAERALTESDAAGVERLVRGFAA
jgi:phosphoenolpyruvate-protein kinase (PTS system EI component)